LELSQASYKVQTFLGGLIKLVSMLLCLVFKPPNCFLYHCQLESCLISGTLLWLCLYGDYIIVGVI